MVSDTTARWSTIEWAMDGTIETLHKTKWLNPKTQYKVNTHVSTKGFSHNDKACFLRSHSSAVEQPLGNRHRHRWARCKLHPCVAFHEHGVHH